MSIGFTIPYLKYKKIKDSGQYLPIDNSAELFLTRRNDD